MRCNRQENRFGKQQELLNEVLKKKLRNQYSDKNGNRQRQNRKNEGIS